MEVWKRHLGANNTEGPCAACGRTIHISDFEVGHKVSLAAGGADTFENMRSVCRSCNIAMGSTMSIDEYREMFCGPAAEEPEQQTTRQPPMDSRVDHPEPIPQSFKLRSDPPLNIIVPECVVGDLLTSHEGDTGLCAGCGQKHCRKHSNSGATRDLRLCPSCWHQANRRLHGPPIQKERK